MNIIAFTGMPFSGKSEAVKIAQKLQVPVVRMGDLVWKEVENQGLSLTSENVGEIANEMRKKHGKNVWAKKTINHINNKKISGTIIIDGVRNIEEINLFKNTLDCNFILIAIDIPDNIRYNRAQQRKRIDDDINIEKIKERDQREIKWGLKNVINQADIIIQNTGSIEELQENIKQIIQTIIKMNK